MRRTLAVVLALTTTACATELGEGPTPFDEAAEETGVDAPFDTAPVEGEADGFDTAGPTVAAGASTEVWAISNAWADTDTAAARRAGVAWGENSGLDWEQKFDRWIDSFEVVARAGYGQTFRMRTPFGTRSFDAPTLECAEVALFLRATFASWYGLPFFVAGYDSSTRQRMYAGHFGFVTSSGARLARFPAFRTQYRDHTAGWREGQAWPSDAALRRMRLGDDDAVAFLSSGGTVAGAGAYFDEIFLNKRVGYFMRLLLLYFGSVNLVDGNNTFHVTAESTAAGDMLIERWQRRGIGHVMPVMRRRDASGGHFEVSIASGSMPRRQPVWNDTAQAKHYFLDESTGGPGTATDGEAYARLGGGLRRWRTAVLSGGRWRNLVRQADRAAFIADTDVERIAARPARFAELLAEVSPEQRRDAAVASLEAARAHLAMYPASCSARTRREDARRELVEVMTTYFGETAASVDARYATLADYVLAELEYTASRTCCWNRWTGAMHEIVIAYAEEEQRAAATRGECVSPTVFRAEAEDRAAGGDGYARWRRYAESIGRGGEWRAWSEDETCAQRAAIGDTVTARGPSTAFCSLAGGGSGEASCDPTGGDDTILRASMLSTSASAQICAGDSDVWRVDAGTRTLSVAVRFRHASGDLDVQALRADGSVLASSEGTGDEERVSGTGTFYVRVFGYGGAMNAYSIAVE